jgi:hypothetical protein
VADSDAASNFPPIHIFENPQRGDWLGATEAHFQKVPEWFAATFELFGG